MKYFIYCILVFSNLYAKELHSRSEIELGSLLVNSVFGGKFVVKTPLNKKLNFLLNLETQSNQTVFLGGFNTIIKSPFIPKDTKGHLNWSYNPESENGVRIALSNSFKSFESFFGVNFQGILSDIKPEIYFEGDLHFFHLNQMSFGAFGGINTNYFDGSRTGFSSVYSSNYGNIKFEYSPPFLNETKDHSLKLSLVSNFGFLGGLTKPLAMREDLEIENKIPRKLSKFAENYLLAKGEGGYCLRNYDKISKSLKRYLRNYRGMRLGNGTVFLSDSNRAYYDGVADIVRKWGTCIEEIVVESHNFTHNENKKINKEFSKIQGNIAKDYLVQRGIGAGKIKVRPFGDKKPKKDLAKLDGNRVDFKFKIQQL